MTKKRIALKRQHRANKSLQQLALIVIGYFLVVGFLDSREESPRYVHPGIIDFSAIQNYQLRKQTFIDFLVPKIKAQNQKIAEKRIQIQKAIAANNGAALCEIAKEINLSCSELNLGNQLLKRIDQIPLAIVLSQAILESGWGTSRFSEQGLSLFGMWCFSRGCGIVPSERDEDRSHEIRSYASVAQSIEDYYQLINYSNNFESFREIRSNLDDLHSKNSIIALTRGLTNYSGIDAREYIQRVRKIILSEDLLKYN